MVYSPGREAGLLSIRDCKRLQRKHPRQGYGEEIFGPYVERTFWRGAISILLEFLDGLLVAIKEKALELYRDRLITLAVYGSVGRRVPRLDSDVDLLIVASPLPEGRLRRMEEFSHLRRLPG